MNKGLLTIAATLTIGLIAGCGGDGSMHATSATMSGAVADGYLVGATVFLDRDGNYRLDAGEPTAITDVNGAYTLKVDAADVGAYPIVAMAIKGVTVDKDSNQPVLNSYILSMPRESVSGTVSSNFISPMSTLIRELMATGNYTMQQAMDQLRTQLGLPVGVDMMADFLRDPDNANYRAMHTAAQNMAALMGSQMSQVLSTSGSTTNVDVNRYRGMMGTIFSNISSVRGSDSDSRSAMSNLMGSMMGDLENMTPGQPFRNMSTSFRGGMMGGGAGNGYRGAMMRPATASGAMM
ncbi:MAG: hypothetical protein A2075_04720 [Geobacteraceae bacterium GWC2_58_44]|nr:MAG: hypothetical protein A2075_04720 [Geobacteraceae bacterium GWC2_58_44]